MKFDLDGFPVGEAPRDRLIMAFLTKQKMLSAHGIESTYPCRLGDVLAGLEMEQSRSAASSLCRSLRRLHAQGHLELIEPSSPDWGSGMLYSLSKEAWRKIGFLAET